jgi:chromosome segregation ATPase
MDNQELVTKFQELKSKHAELMAEKLKYEAKKEQLSSEIKAIQDKYTEYDLSTTESVEKIIADLTNQLDAELRSINEQYEKIKMV